MKAYMGVDVYIHIFLTSALAGGEWSPSCPGRFTPRENSPGTHWIGGWVDPRAGLDDGEKILNPTGSRTPTLCRPASRYTDYAIPAPIFIMYGPVFVLVRSSTFRIEREKIYCNNCGDFRGFPWFAALLGLRMHGALISCVYS
jgi:hypothetical protein